MVLWAGSLRERGRVVKLSQLFFKIKMNQTLLRHVASQSLRKNVPTIKAGMSVKVSQKIREGEKERIQNFEGLVIAVNGGKGVDATFTVRKIVGGIGVEKIFPLHSKTITKIEVIKQAKVRRSKLYYMRELRGKAARMSETHVREVVVDDEADAKKEAKKAEKEKEELSKKEKVEGDSESKDEKEKPEEDEVVVETEEKVEATSNAEGTEIKVEAKKD